MSESPRSPLPAATERAREALTYGRKRMEDGNYSFFVAPHGLTEALANDVLALASALEDAERLQAMEAAATSEVRERLIAAVKRAEDAERERDEALGGEPYIDAMREIAGLNADLADARAVIQRLHDALTAAPCERELTGFPKCGSDAEADGRLGTCGRCEALLGGRQA